MTVTEADATQGEKHTRNVLSDSKLHNLMAREYWYESSTTVKTPSQAKLNNSSFVVIQAIDGPLFYDRQHQFKYTRKQLTTEAKRRR